MEYNFVEIVTLAVIGYLLFTIFRLEQRVKTLDYKVEKLSGHQNTDLYEELDQELKTLIHQGKDVQAVKRVRETKGYSLLEAKQYVDALKLKTEG
ncbi:hypothetical protein JMA_32570 [Jeotgalibacillus malaysiensis]|uniref:Ribosomal protein L7/L12 C-terminal domain-containing protein n=1 Tax=Jeotgalibacillus malaysiensis TaxID=1508404 RepID=A0A0B5AX30_9BACL|nr:hypothetical protein [Jeotgalibacillus malaysiensis]AJD92574.1 hypothetical protein JMA_32570 [Jeotgalibacillus malaysiensis]